MADTFTLTLESDPVTVSDSGSLTEARTLQRSSSVSDSAALSEARVLERQSSVVDSAVLTDAAVLAMTDAKTGVDSAALTEALLIYRESLKTGTDSATLSEARAIAISADRTDSAVLTDTAALERQSSVSDSGTLTEARTLDITDTRSVTDSGTLTEAASLATEDLKNVSDSAALTEARTLERQSSVSDSAALAEARMLERQSSVSDSGILTEARTLGITDEKTGTDSAVLTDTAALQRQSSVSDSAALAEARAIDIASSVTDAGTLTESASTGGTDLKAASDSFTLSEDETLTTEDLKATSDTASMSEARTLGASFDVADLAALIEAFAAAADLSLSDTGVLSEQALGGMDEYKNASDSATLSELASLLQTLQMEATDAFAFTEGPGPSDYASVIRADTPTAYYRFTETSGSSYEDATGNGHTGTTAAPPTLAQPGITGSSDELAFHFDPATSQRIGLPSTDFVGFSDRTWTMECWVKPDTDVAANAVHIGAGRTTGTAPTLLLGHGNPASQLRIVVRNDAGTSVDLTTSGLTLNDGQWHHVVLTQNGTAVRAYVDGVQVLTSSTGPGTPYTITRTTIAALQRNTLTGLFKGLMDEVALYNYPLSLAQVEAHYAAGLIAPDTPFVRAAVSALDSGSISETVDTIQQALKDAIDSGLLSESDEVAVFVGVEYTHNLPPQVIKGGYRGDANVFAPVMAGEAPPYAAVIVGAHSARIVLLSPRHEGIVVDPDDDALVGYEAAGTLR